MTRPMEIVQVNSLNLIKKNFKIRKKCVKRATHMKTQTGTTERNTVHV